MSRYRRESEREEPLSPELFVTEIARRLRKMEAGLMSRQAVESFIRTELQRARNETLRDSVTTVIDQLSEPEPITLQAAHGRGGWNAAAAEAGRQLRAKLAGLLREQVEPVCQEREEVGSE